MNEISWLVVRPSLTSVRPAKTRMDNGRCNRELPWSSQSPGRCGCPLRNVTLSAISLIATPLAISLQTRQSLDTTMASKKRTTKTKKSSRQSHAHRASPSQDDHVARRDSLQAASQEQSSPQAATGSKTAAPQVPDGGATKTSMRKQHRAVTRSMQKQSSQPPLLRVSRDVSAAQLSSPTSSWH